MFITRLGYFLLLSILFFSCKEQEITTPNLGEWRVLLETMDEKIMPFTFVLKREDDTTYTMQVYNAEEIIEVDEITINKDSIIVRMPVFEGYLAGTFTANEIKGSFIKESLDRVVPFTAVYGETNRFKTVKKPNVDVSGVWETVFSKNTSDSYLAKGIFSQNGNKLKGTFRTITGDYRYLDGVLDGDSLKLSAFDGGHAFLFMAKVTDSTLKGTFYSGNHFKEPFEAIRNDNFKLTNPDSLTYIKEGYDKINFSFPDANGNMISLSDERYKNKVVLVQILGSWCPNCLDETKFYVDYLKNNKQPDLEIIGLAFEYAKTKEKAFESIARLKERIGVEYPIVLAQYGSSDKVLAQEKLPMLNHVLSYPTTVYIDKKGTVRKIHTGFNGPATGNKFTAFKTEFDTLVHKLLNE